MPKTHKVDDYIESISTIHELRERLSQNQRERSLIKRLIQLSEQRDKLLMRDGGRTDG